MAVEMTTRRADRVAYTTTAHDAILAIDVTMTDRTKQGEDCSLGGQLAALHILMSAREEKQPHECCCYAEIDDTADQSFRYDLCDPCTCVVQ